MLAMSKTEQLRRDMVQTWTLRDVAKLFRVTPMTVLNWVERPPSGREPLAVLRIPSNRRSTLRFWPDDVREYGRRYNLPMHPVRIERP